VLAAIVLPMLMPPKPRPMLVAPPTSENVVTAPVMHETPTQRPALVVDASSVADPMRTAAHVGTALPRRTAPIAPAAAAPTFRAVRIQPRPANVWYSINGETARLWSSNDERVLPVGQPSNIRFHQDGFEPYIWRSEGNVTAGDDPLLVVARMRRVSSPAAGALDAQVEARP